MYSKIKKATRKSFHVLKGCLTYMQKDSLTGVGLWESGSPMSSSGHRAHAGKHKWPCSFRAALCQDQAVWALFTSSACLSPWLGREVAWRAWFGCIDWRSLFLKYLESHEVFLILLCIWVCGGKVCVWIRAGWWGGGREGAKLNKSRKREGSIQPQERDGDLALETWMDKSNYLLVYQQKI